MTDIVVDDFAETGAHIKSEDISGSYSREEIMLAPNQGTLKAGTVLGIITATGATKGMYAVYNDAATNGTQVAAGPLHATTTTHATNPVEAVAHVRHCELFKSRLRFAAGTSDTAKANAYSDMAAAGLIVR